MRLCLGIIRGSNGVDIGSFGIIRILWNNKLHMVGTSRYGSKSAPYPASYHNVAHRIPKYPGTCLGTTSHKCSPWCESGATGLGDIRGDVRVSYVPGMTERALRILTHALRRPVTRGHGLSDTARLRDMCRIVQVFVTSCAMPDDRKSRSGIRQEIVQKVLANRNRRWGGIRGGVRVSCASTGLANPVSRYPGNLR